MSLQVRYLLFFILIFFNTTFAEIDFFLRIAVGDNDLSALNADGFYSLQFDDLKKKLQSAGRESDIDGIPISAVRLFGSPADTLPESMTNEFSPNSVEIPIIAKDINGNGIFDSGDSVIFFGYGTALWKKSNSNSGMDYYFSHSPYSFYQYFYLGAGGSGMRLQTQNSEGGTPKNLVWKKFVRSEKDLILRDNYFGDNFTEENTGKEWFWAWGSRKSSISVQNTEFQNSIKTLKNLSGDSVWIGVSFFPRRSTAMNSMLSSQNFKDRMSGINFNAYFQGEQLQNPIDTLPDGSFVFLSKNAKTESNTYRIEILQSSQNTRFDGISVSYPFDPQKSDGDEWLLPSGIGAGGTINLPVDSDSEILRIKDGIPQYIINGSVDVINSNEDVKYFLHKKSKYKSPAFIEPIAYRLSQVSAPLNIPAHTAYLIITAENFQSAAVKLKQFRESGSAPATFSTSVVLAEDIYQFYGAQNSPVAIRDYIRFARNRAPNLRFVLLAGGGNYDYRKIRAGAKASIIPPYEKEDFSSDDFFAVLDSGEEIRFGNYDLDLSVGRLPVETAAEFENYIQKVYEYETVRVMDNGIWRNTIILSADDAMQGTEIDGIPHTEQMERTAALLDTASQNRGFSVELRKIPLLQYERDGNYKKPEAAKELLLRLNQGAFFTMYYGHGNAVQWADEDLLNTASINDIYNAGKYTILGSFSCLTSRFDDVKVQSLGEVFLNSKGKGAIASIGSLRESYASYNESFSQKFLRAALFSNNQFLGEAILEAKKSIGNYHSAERYNNEKYSLLGEPVLSLPSSKISVNLDIVPDTIQALDKISLSGSAFLGGAQLQNGNLKLQILEGAKQHTLSQNLGDGNFYSVNVQIVGNPIYSEDLKVENGKFSTEFITPRKLSLGDTNAQIRLWAHKAGNAGIGRSLNGGISLFGTSSFADSIKDNSPPTVKIYPCIRAGTTAPFEENEKIILEIPACLDVVIEDSTGIDYREEADEGIYFELNPAAAPFHPFSFAEQTGKRAVARVNFGTGYDPGDYIFKAAAQDVLGNAALRSLRLSLSEQLEDGLADVFNVPNPMGKNGTTFYFKNLAEMNAGSATAVSIKIFDQNGKLVRTIKNAVSGITKFDGKDSRGRLLANGLYHYVVHSNVTTANGKKRTFAKKQKLVISR
ncbi:hypothetical protein AGMMS49938_12280 [Fibrobacterales bacterium]|nr:hypothetical protein AGMMS49938_12280 [Fibrobacterales bacterium]